jgi:hypothetical protein
MQLTNDLGPDAPGAAGDEDHGGQRFFVHDSLGYLEGGVIIRCWKHIGPDFAVGRSPG